MTYVAALPCEKSRALPACDFEGLLGPAAGLPPPSGWTSQKSPRRAFRAYRSQSISLAVRKPRCRKSGTGGHQPCKAF